MWDYVLTLDQEVSHRILTWRRSLIDLDQISRVWSAKKTVGTTIFFFVSTHSPWGPRHPFTIFRIDIFRLVFLFSTCIV